MRKGIEGLAALAQDVLRQKPTGGAVFAFRGRGGDRLKLLYFDGQGFCLYLQGPPERPLSVAVDRRWNGSADVGATGHAVGGDRLATTQLVCAAGTRLLILCL